MTKPEGYPANIGVERREETIGKKQQLTLLWDLHLIETETGNNDCNDLRRNDEVRSERYLMTVVDTTKDYQNAQKEAVKAGRKREDELKYEKRQGSSEQHRTLQPQSADSAAEPENTGNKHPECAAGRAPAFLDDRIDANIKERKKGTGIQRPVH